jgi:hypothetical protein
MRLTAYSIEARSGIWRTWDQVRLWYINGGNLVVTFHDMTVEEMPLPTEVIGLADDSPRVITSASWGSQYRPAPEKRDRPSGQPA